MRILLYGGHFDPITNAHKKIAIFARDYTDYNSVWFLPSYKKSFPNEDKEDKGASPEDRVNMIKLLSRGISRIHCCTEEVDNKITKGTYHVIKMLEKKYPEHTFGLLIGSDNANSIEKWKAKTKIIHNIPCIIVFRYNHIIKDPLMWLKNGRNIIIPREIFTTDTASSTLIRRAIRNGNWKKEDVKYLPHMSKVVLNYIFKKELYKPETA